MSKTDTTRAFNGDHILLAKVRELKKTHKAKRLIETGTFKGDTTAVMAGIFKEVHTSEINKTYFMEAAQNLGSCSNVRMVLSDSRTFIRNLPEDALKESIFFLDAHWILDVPHVGELMEIANRGVKPVVIVHDFYVPGKSTEPTANFGYDVYNGVAFNWEYIAQAVESIYGANGYRLTYPDAVAGAARGYVIIEPA
jgi:predicted O-methyltransferase YrrM